MFDRPLPPRAVDPMAEVASREPLTGALNANPGRFRDLLAEDFRTHGGKWHSPGFWTLFWHRFGNRRMDLPRWLRPVATGAYLAGRVAVRTMHGVELHYTVPVGRRVRIEHFGGMVLQARRIGNDVTIRQTTTLGLSRPDDPTGWPVIEDGVDLGCHVCVLGRVTVGRGARVGAGAVVLTDVPPGATAVGVPARVIGQDR